MLAVAVAAAWPTPAAAASASAADPIAGRYLGAAPPHATLEVRREGEAYRIRLEGGSTLDGAAADAAAPADCTVEARGILTDGRLLRAPFGPVDEDTFSYPAAEAGREGRTVELAFTPGSAEVVAADTLGYCGLGVELRGRYRRER